MKKLKLCAVVLVAVILTIIVVQSCNQGGNIVQPRQPDQHPSALFNQSSNSNVTVTNVEPLKVDTKTFQKVKSTYNDGKVTKFKNLHVTSRTNLSSQSPKLSPFNKYMLGKLKYDKGKIFSYSDETKIIEIPAVKSKEKGEFRIARLIVKKNRDGVSTGFLSVVKTNDKFIHKLKHLKNLKNKKDRKIPFTGTVKLYMLNGKRIEDVKGVMYKKGQLKKVLSFGGEVYKTKNALSPKKLAGSHLVPNSCCAEMREMINEAWNNAITTVKDALDTIGDNFPYNVIEDNVSVLLSGWGCSEFIGGILSITFSGGTLFEIGIPMAVVGGIECAGLGISYYNLTNDLCNEYPYRCAQLP